MHVHLAGRGRFTRVLLISFDIGSLHRWCHLARAAIGASVLALAAVSKACGASALLINALSPAVGGSVLLRWS